jgi:lipopolysaccharide biosynthesis glycosyltransferase
MKKNICVTLDKKFTMPAAIMLESLIFNSGVNFEIHIIVDDANWSGYSNLSNLIKKRGANVHLHEINQQQISGLIIKYGLSAPLYYRLFVTSILPKDIDQVLFLDCDLIILKDISEVFNNLESEFDLAAVDVLEIDIHQNRPWSIGSLDVSISSMKAKFGLQESETWVNTGVMLINLNRWRKLNYEKEFMLLVEKVADKLNWNDECVINAVCHNKKVLHWGWNARVNLLNSKSSSDLSNIKIAHAIGGNKPWNNAHHPMREMFFHYLLMNECWQKKLIILMDSLIRLREHIKLKNLKRISLEALFLLTFPLFPRLAINNFYVFTKKY